MTTQQPTNTLLLREILLLHERVERPTAFPFSLPFTKQLDPLVFRSPVTFFVGENGTGKSTLLESLATAWGLNPEGGSRNFKFSTRSSHSQELADALRVVKGTRQAKDGYFLRAESFFNVATEIESLDRGGGGRKLIDSYGGRSLHEQSHGESFLALLMHRFRGDGLYVLDEPEAALSASRQLSFLARMRELADDGAQFIIATHSPLLLSYPGAQILEFSKAGIKTVNYDDVEFVRLYRMFLERPEGMLSELFRSDPA